ncbi:thioesterase family protein [Actinocrinis puniceicyclus]|uniref:Thioesterase family protein n=1 Tax=Actinocrinis puniceicyclus TaxID=977794 RepID=A0A8J7WMW6_9ACTN|nr:thioesterase family protein [Actinocrinis puniceicyclus]MBS2962359.1 thioesterase family protein [Actinocrinis puniceicyclus]
MTTTTPEKSPAGELGTVIVSRPRFEGSNICTWIGFKHVMYLVEEAVLEHLRRTGLAPRRLYEEHGLGLDIVDGDARILTALHMDDEVRTQVIPQAGDDSGELVLRTRTSVERPGEPRSVLAATASVRAVFRLDDDAPQPPDGVPAVVRRIERGGAVGVDAPLSYAPPAPLEGRGIVGDTESGLAAPGANAIVWRWRIPYFYCHYSRRLQHSGYLRLMEEVVDLFLAERGISIRTLVDGRRWIPVVPRARVEILAEALMEEELYVVFTVEEIFKRATYTARMECYVRRGGQYVCTARGRITHGYAEILDRRDWRLVEFDEPTLAALRGDAAG